MRPVPRTLLFLFILPILLHADDDDTRYSQDNQVIPLTRLEYPELTAEILLDNIDKKSRRRHETDDESPLLHDNIKFYVHKKRHSNIAFTTSPSTDDSKQREREELAVECLKALDRLLQYFMQHTNELIADGFLGVAMAHGQLNTALKLDNNFIHSIEELIKRLQHMCNKILSAVQPMIDEGLIIKVQGIQHLLNPEFWEGSELKEEGKLSMGRISPWPIPALSGALSEKTSDECLGQLLSSQCNISDDCWQAETSGDAFGYSLTHRLLFLQTARQMGCSEKIRNKNGESVNNMIENICSNILVETRMIADKDFPHGSRDLLMEQMGLCGTEGFIEFAQLDLIRNILQWQHLEGCYGVDIHHRSKRSERALGEKGCLVHFTAVAAGALATSARLLLTTTT